MFMDDVAFLAARAIVDGCCCRTGTWKAAANGGAIVVEIVEMAVEATTAEMSSSFVIFLEPNLIFMLVFGFCIV